MSLKALVNNRDLYDSFLEEISKRLVQSRTRLENQSEPSEIYRAQGEIKALRSLLQLKETING